MAAKKDVQTVENDLELPDYNPAIESWDDLASNSDSVLGHDLAKDALFDALAAVPFIITKVTFRRGAVRNGVQAAYASCEAVIAPENVLKRRRVNLDLMPFTPGDSVIFNDGSTGIYRQIVAYLAATGRIDLPDDLPENGAYGESRYDLPPNKWTAVHAGELRYEDGDTNGWADYEVNVRLSCPRGIRLSEYTNDFNPNGSKTRYLA